MPDSRLIFELTSEASAMAEWDALTLDQSPQNLEWLRKQIELADEAQRMLDAVLRRRRGEPTPSPRK